MDAGTLDAYARAQARLEHAGGYTWREGVNATLHGLGFRDEHLDRDLSTFSRRRADARVARARARRRPRPAAARRADEPSRHRRRSSGWRRTCSRSTPRSCWSRTTAGSSRRSAPPCWSSRAGAGATSRAPGTRGARRRPRASWRSAGRSRSRRREIAALERFVTRFRAGTRARQAQSRVKQLEKIERVDARPARRQGARLRVQAARADRPGRLRGRGRRAADRRRACCCDDFEFWLERGEHVTLVGANGTGKTTLITTLAGERELDARQAAPRPQPQARAAHASTPRSSARPGPCWRRASARRG